MQRQEDPEKGAEKIKLSDFVLSRRKIQDMYTRIRTLTHATKFWHPKQRDMFSQLLVSAIAQIQYALVCRNRLTSGGEIAEKLKGEKRGNSSA